MEKDNKLLLIGGGGHCRSVIDVIESSTDYKIVGIIDIPQKINQLVLNKYKIIGSDDQLERLFSITNNFFITIGQTGLPTVRKKLYHKIKGLGGNLVTIFAQNSYISQYAQIKEGSIVMHQALVNTNAKIGVNCIINTKALIEHDVIVADHTHIATNVTLNGGVKIGNNCFIGSGSVILQNIHIADNVIIGANSVVIHDITEPGVYAGVPAKKIK